MSGRRRHVFLGSLALCLGLYAAVVLATPGLHHDFECHLKSPGHCQACVANPLAPRAASTGDVGTVALVELGRAAALRAVPAPMQAAPLFLGRAPPR